jgi:hypothetical protein
MALGALVVHIFNRLVEPSYEVYYSAYISAVVVCMMIALIREDRRRGHL